MEFLSSLISLRIYNHKIFTVRLWINGEAGGNVTFSFFINLIEMFNAALIKTETRQVRITNTLLNNKGVTTRNSKTYLKTRIIKMRALRKNRKIV